MQNLNNYYDFRIGLGEYQRIGEQILSGFWISVNYVDSVYWILYFVTKISTPDQVRNTLV